MDLKICSFNCRGFNISKVKYIESILSNCSILLLQETWFLPREVGTLNKYFADYNTCGISSIDDKVLLKGRPYGGCSFLYEKALSASIESIEVDSNRVCCIRIKTHVGLVYVINVYMPCDTTSNTNIYEYHKALSNISTIFNTYNVVYCIIAGDMNTDLRRIKSLNTIHLNNFISNENLKYVLNVHPNDIQFTYSGINGSVSLIDHFIVSENLTSHIVDYSMFDSVDNLSDHVPLLFILHCKIMNIAENTVPLFIPKPLWRTATKDDIVLYHFELNRILSSFVVPSELLTCNNCEHKQAHEHLIILFHDNIVKACRIAMSEYIPCTAKGKKLNVIPGWDSECDVAREQSLLWHCIWQQCDKPTDGIVHSIMKSCRSKYHYLLRKLKKDKQKYIRQSISSEMLSSNHRDYWKSVKAIRKNNFNSTVVVDGLQDNTDIANHFMQKYCELFNSVRSSNIAIDELCDRIDQCIQCNCDTSNCMHSHVINVCDVRRAVGKLKPDKINEDKILFSDNFIHGSELLFSYLSMLFTIMISHSFAPCDLLKSSFVPIPKGTKVSLSDSEKYRSIAISSILCKIFDHIIIDQQSQYLSTSDYQFGFKSKSSTTLCTTMVNETIQYYCANGAKPVYLLLLDASKAFDRVSFSMLFNILLDKSVCPRIVKLLYYMYTNQSCYVTWSNHQSNPFAVANGVKQGGVISPLLFSLYVDNLFIELKSLGLGCHVGSMYAGSFGYADDIALIAPSIYSLEKMISICQIYADKFKITFNPSKSKLLCYNTFTCYIAPIYLNGQIIPVVQQDKHLGNFISSDIYDRNIYANVCDFYQRSHGVVNDFRSCDSYTLDCLHRTYCMHMYSCELWNLNDTTINTFRIAWRRMKRRIWNLPPRSHNSIVQSLTYNFDEYLEHRIIKYVYNSLNHSNIVCNTILKTKILCPKSTFSENYHFLSYKYQLSQSDWCNDIDYLLGKVKMKTQDLYNICNPVVYTVRELCYMRDNCMHGNILNYDEINMLIDVLCTD